MFAQAIGGSRFDINAHIDKDEIHPHQDVISKLREFDRFGRAHLFYHPEYCRFMRELGGKIVFLYRDPRDCIVSWIYYLDDIANHEGYFNFDVSNEQKLIDLSRPERIDAILQRAKYFYGRYVGWLDTPDDIVYKLKYEDILLDGKNTLQNLIGWMGEDLISVLNKEADCSKPEYMLERIDPKTCKHFRRGIIGDWRNHFTGGQVKLFWETCGDLMEKFNYERL